MRTVTAVISHAAMNRKQGGCINAVIPCFNCDFLFSDQSFYKNSNLPGQGTTCFPLTVCWTSEATQPLTCCTPSPGYAPSPGQVGGVAAVLHYLPYVRKWPQKILTMLT